jgi:hypothetical protein
MKESVSFSSFGIDLFDRPGWDCARRGLVHLLQHRLPGMRLAGCLARNEVVRVL